MSRSVIFILLCLLLPPDSPAQFFYFGRNKVQYTDFDWHVLKTEHFDIYYYREMRNLAERGAALAEESYAELVGRFNHNVANRIPLIFYSSHLHFQQTNVTPGFIPEGVGGFFEFMKGRVVIPYNGSMWDFRHVIRHELVHVFMHSKVNRVLVDHRITPDRLPPLWFVEGLAEYWSIEWDVQADMVLRDAVVSGYLVPSGDIDAIYGTYLMYKEGQAILEYVGETYGEERILLFLENFWKSTSFEQVFTETTGKSYREFDREWTYALKKKYYPLLTGADNPSAVSSPVVTGGFNSKPVYFPGDGGGDIYFIGNHSGYSAIYRVPSGMKEPDPEVVVQGERAEEFEAFHLFQSGIDMSTDGLLAFVTKSGENDALHIFDVRAARLEDTYHFDALVVLGSPSWAPGGKRIAFNAVDKSGSSDLYVWDRESELLERLTDDIYDERDPAWSPDGHDIVFSSDRGPYGRNGKYNLFSYDTHSGIIRYVTRGPESYAAPAWSPDGRWLLFTSDAGGARNVWMAPMAGGIASGPMRRITSFTTGAFDPAWADSALLYVAFEEFSFGIRCSPNIFAMYDSSAVTRDAAPATGEAPWRPSYPASIPDPDEVSGLRYSGEYSLDVAHSQIVTDPVFGTYGGAFLSLSDLLGNEQYYFLLYNTAQSSDDILSSFNIAISRVSLEKRANYAYGIYRFSGRRYDLADPDEFFFETVFGGYLTVSYPISTFRRIALLTSVSSSEKDATDGAFSNIPIGSIDLSRRALFLSHSIAYTHDNSLWGPSGPLDGSRYNITLAYTTDVRTSNANYFSVIADYRHYFRIAQRSAYAVRLWLFYNDGKESRRFFMGGSWDLRGYPRWSIRGKKLWLVSHELRFPFLDRLALGFPFGTISLAGFRGALFFDAGGAWDDVYKKTYGSTGLGFRLNLFGAIVLRYDLGKRIERNFSTFQSGVFQQFFFGWDF